MPIPVSFRFLIAVVAVAIIVVLSVTPGYSRADSSIFSWIVTTTPTPVQKLLHVIAYAVLALLWAWALESISSRMLRLLLAFGIVVFIGAMLEWYQTRVPGRYGTLLDVLLNAAGAVAGLLAVFFFI